MAESLHRASRLNLAAFMWRVGGAHAALLFACPRPERTKYAVLGAINIGLSALVGWLTYVWRTLSDRPDPTPSFPVEIALGCLAFAVASGICIAASHVSSMRQLGTVAYAIGAFMLLPVVGALYGLILFLYFRVPEAEALTYAALSIWALLTTVLVRATWRSPVYDGMLLRELKPEHQDQEISSSTALSSGTSEEWDERDEALEAAHQSTFEREPRNLEAARQLIEVRKRLHKFEEAAQVIDSLISYDTENIELIREKAELYRRMGDDRRYRKTLEQADPLLARAAFEQNLGKRITLSSMEVSDLEFFGDFTWEFQPQVTVLLGKNGYGKSHLLRALAAMLQNDEEVVRQFYAGSGHRARMRVDIDREGTAVTTTRTRLVFDESFGQVPLLAIPDMRYVDKSEDSVGPSKDKMTNLRLHSAWHFMREEPYQGMIMEFLYALCLDYLDQKDLDLPIFKLLEETVGKLTDSKFEFAKIIRRGSTRFEISVLSEGNDRPLPLQKASQGTLSVLAIFGIIYRYLKAIHEDVAEADITVQQGIVVIDEIDAHLHPSWQQAVLQLLRDTFPNVQFIVTAHSPLVIAGCREREVAVLRKESDGFRADVLPDHFIGATSEDMYQRLFEIEEKDTTYRRLNTLSGRKPKIENEIAELEKRSELNSRQQSRLEKLKRQLYYLREFQEVKAKHDKEARIENAYQHLEMEVNQLRGENSNLRKELEAQKSSLAMPKVEDLEMLLQELAAPNDGQRALLEATAKSWMESGRIAESATIYEVLVRINPENLQHLKQLALLYQSSERFRDANRVIEAALRLAPDDKELVSVSKRLKNLLAS